MRNYAGTCKGICSYNLIYNVLIQLLPLKSLVFVVHFLNAFWHGNEAFPKGSSQNEIVPLLVILHLPYTIVNIEVWKYVVTRVVIKINFFRLCRTRVARVALGCTCVIRVASVSHSYCKLDQILYQHMKERRHIPDT